MLAIYTYTSCFLNLYFTDSKAYMRFFTLGAKNVVSMNKVKTL